MNSQHTQSSFTGEYIYPQYNADFKIPLRTPETTSQSPFPPPTISGVLDNAHEPQNTPGRFGKVETRFPANLKRSHAGSGDNVMEVDPEDNSATPDHMKRRRMGNALMEMLEEDLPADLKSLMKPLCCDLCNVKLNSVLTANMHYESKNHDKKINNWLQEWSKETGQAVPQRQRTNKEGPVGPNAFHCEVCDIPLTSLQHARTHYTGRKHQLAASGRANPSGSGFYNKEGKWVRQQTKVAPVDPTGRFGIGESFQKPSPIPTTSNQASFCALCNVSVTSESQMKIHLEGSKHNKRLKASTAATFSPMNEDTVMECIIQPGNPPKRDISINRTPSGNYYCAICDVTVANEHLFNQHLDSKKHMKKLKSSQA